MIELHFGAEKWKQLDGIHNLLLQFCSIFESIRLTDDTNKLDLLKRKTCCACTKLTFRDVIRACSLRLHS